MVVGFVFGQIETEINGTIKVIKKIKFILINKKNNKK